MKMNKWLILTGCICCLSSSLLMLPEQAVHAGDEVDYSAPYMTVENGELVTKYPALEHDQAQADAQPNSKGIGDSPKPYTRSPVLWGLALIGLLLTVALVRRRNSRKINDGDLGA